MNNARSMMLGLTVVISLIGHTSQVLAENLIKYDASRGEYARRDEDRVYVVGKVINIAHELQHRPSGADAQDSLFSKGRQGLETTGGQIWTFVDNIKGQQLQWNKDYLGEYVKVLGWIYHEAHYIEIDSFSMEGKEFIWDETQAVFEPEGGVKKEEEHAPDVKDIPEAAEHGGEAEAGHS